VTSATTQAARCRRGERPPHEVSGAARRCRDRRADSWRGWSHGSRPHKAFHRETGHRVPIPSGTRPRPHLVTMNCFNNSRDHRGRGCPTSTPFDPACPVKFEEPLPRLLGVVGCRADRKGLPGGDDGAGRRGGEVGPEDADRRISVIPETVWRVGLASRHVTDWEDAFLVLYNERRGALKDENRLFAIVDMQRDTRPWGDRRAAIEERGSGEVGGDGRRGWRAGPADEGWRRRVREHLGVGSARAAHAKVLSGCWVWVCVHRDSVSPPRRARRRWARPRCASRPSPACRCPVRCPRPSPPRSPTDPGHGTWCRRRSEGNGKRDKGVTVQPLPTVDTLSPRSRRLIWYGTGRDICLDGPSRRAAPDSFTVVA